MSRRTAEANKAIRLAWQREYDLVQEGKGTRDWTEEQQKDILDPEKGKAYDENGRVFEGQHMKSVEKYPEYQGDPDNIQFLTKEEHLEAHRGNWQNPTNWYYDPEKKQFLDFGDKKYTPCKVIKLSNPIIISSEPVENDLEMVNSDVQEQDKIITEEPRAPTSKVKNDNIVKATVAKSQISSEDAGIFKCIINGAKKGLTFVVENKKVISAIVVAVCGAVLKEKIRNSNSGSGQLDNVTSFDGIDLNSDYEEDGYTSEESDEIYVNQEDVNSSNDSEHSYTPNDVPAGKQRYHTKNGTEWREKPPYHRGGNKDEDSE